MKVKEQKEYLQERQTALRLAQADGDDRQISLALAGVGQALFASRKYGEGLSHFDRAIQLAKKGRGSFSPGELSGTQNIGLSGRGTAARGI
jgi:tetratricopeptide (TPR) repeat protein